MSKVDIYLDLEGIQSRGAAAKQAEHAGVLAIAGVLLTAEIYNRFPHLNEDDLPPNIRKVLFDPVEKAVTRPVAISLRSMEKITRLDQVKRLLKMLPFADFDEITLQIRLSSFEEASEWFLNQESRPFLAANPVLAYFYEKSGSPGVSYAEARKANRPLSADREWIEARIRELSGDEKGAEDLLKLVTIKAPEDVRDRLDDLVLTDDQRKEIAKAGKALAHRDYLRRIGLFEIGKSLLVGPPGTGKTSCARALSRWFGLPLVEVRLSMITSQYLGETSKNVDNVFLLAKRLSPCILFIDEFDYVAKTRTSDDHGAIKRAVNTLLKAIDEISLVEDGVLLLAATNHPQLLDYAAWRRFDKVLSFSLPDLEMRRRILEKILQKMDAVVDLQEVAERTPGYTGSDLRLVVREAVLNALLTERMSLDQDDLLRAVEECNRRGILHPMGQNGFQCSLAKDNA